MINANVWVALLYERVAKKKNITFGSKLGWLFYKRLFKRKVNQYEVEKSENEELTASGFNETEPNHSVE